MEFVYVVPREKLFPEFYPHGLLAFGDEFSPSAFDALVGEHGFFVEREYAERTPALKQLIPYCVVTDGERILLLRRLDKGGEARLHGKLSIGVGGHINPVDAPNSTTGSDAGHESAERAASERAKSILDAAGHREMTEELTLNGPTEVSRYGILNDDSNSVGAVHVGVVQVVTIDGTAEVRETDQLEGRWVTPDELKEMSERGENFETWSRLIVEQLEQLLPAPATA